MKMGFRWFGLNNDSITLAQVKQIPGVTNIVWSLHHKQAGDVWTEAEIKKEKEIIETAGFNIDVVESVNVHEDIKLGKPSRDKYIEIYQDTIRLLSKHGVKVICYNFMPVFDWLRTDLSMPLSDGSHALAYDPQKIKNLEPSEIVKNISDGTLGYTLPGWEPERLSLLNETLLEYKNMTEEKYWNNLKYFLEAVCPVALDCNIQMAIHPDDPPWPVFGLPRVITCKENISKFLNLVKTPSNALTICTGSLGAALTNDLPSIVSEFASNIAFIHVRNVKHQDDGLFYESSHRSCDGSVDVCGVIKALHDSKFQGYIRPDHGRMLWNEKARAGYGLYDRALGVMYIWGLWDAFERIN